MLSTPFVLHITMEMELKVEEKSMKPTLTLITLFITNLALQKKLVKKVCRKAQSWQSQREKTKLFLHKRPSRAGSFFVFTDSQQFRLALFSILFLPN